MVFDQMLLFFHFPGPDNFKNGDNSKSPKNELLGFAMQQENRTTDDYGFANTWIVFILLKFENIFYYKITI